MSDGMRLSPSSPSDGWLRWAVFVAMTTCAAVTLIAFDEHPRGGVSVITFVLFAPLLLSIAGAFLRIAWWMVSGR